MKKFIIFILAIFMCVSIDAKSNKNTLNTKPAQPVGVEKAKKQLPSWMSEREINISRRNPYTGKTSNRYWVLPQVWDESHQYLSTLCITTDLGVKLIECPYYINYDVTEIKAVPLPSFDFNLMYTFGGQLKNNFGFFIGMDYVMPGIKQYNYTIEPSKYQPIMDYRFGVSLMRYFAIGFQVEQNLYYKQYVQPGYRVDPIQYGFYAMGIYRLGHHFGVNANFSYIFNRQWNRYNIYFNEQYRELFQNKPEIMTDLSFHVGLIYYISVR